MVTIAPRSPITRSSFAVILNFAGSCRRGATVLIVQGDQQGKRKMDAKLVGQAIDAAIEVRLQTPSAANALDFVDSCRDIMQSHVVQQVLQEVVRMNKRRRGLMLQANAARIVLASPLGGGGGGGGFFGGFFGGGVSSAGSGNLKLNRPEQQV
jgi:uncharacterized membrane protein YgcG